MTELRETFEASDRNTGFHRKLVALITVVAALPFIDHQAPVTAQQPILTSIALDVDQPSPASDELVGEIDEEGADNEVVESVSVPGNLYTMKAVRLSAKEPGVIESILELGDRVNVGQTIAELDQDLPRAQMNAAEKELAIAKLESENDVDLRFARVSSKVNSAVLERSLAANRQYKKALSKTEIERLRLELQRSCLSAEQAERNSQTNQLNEQLKADQVTIAEIQLNNRTIAAPISGIVTEVSIERGEWVNSGQPIARIVNTDTLRFTGFADSREILPSEIATTAELIVDFKGDIGLGEEIDSEDAVDVTITFVNPEIDPASGLYEVRAEVDNRDQKMFSGLKSILKLHRKN
jgi:multidrug efflux pump subunit AcrA (membrane-fusion protein)